MPKVHKVSKARKARRKYGIKVGDSYYWWKLKHDKMKAGRFYYSKDYPRPWQLVSSPYKREYLRLVDKLSQLDLSSEVKGLTQNLVSIAIAFEHLGNSQLDNIRKMPVSLRGNRNAEILERRAIDSYHAQIMVTDLAKDLNKSKTIAEFIDTLPKAV